MALGPEVLKGKLEPLPQENNTVEWSLTYLQAIEDEEVIPVIVENFDTKWEEFIYGEDTATALSFIFERGESESIEGIIAFFPVYVDGEEEDSTILGDNEIIPEILPEDGSLQIIQAYYLSYKDEKSLVPEDIKEGYDVLFYGIKNDNEADSIPKILLSNHLEATDEIAEGLFDIVEENYPNI